MCFDQEDSRELDNGPQHRRHGRRVDMMAALRPSPKKAKGTNIKTNSIHGLVFVPFVFFGGAYGATSTRATELTDATRREFKPRASPCLRASVVRQQNIGSVRLQP